MELPASACLEAILDATRHPILILSREGGVIEINRGAADWIGVRREAVIGRLLWDVPPWNISAESRARTEQFVNSPEVLQNGAEMVVQNCRFCARTASDGALLIVEGTDLSEVEEERSRTRFAFEAANLSAWTWDLVTNTVTSVSDRGVFGLPPHVNNPREAAIASIHPEDRAFLLAEADAAVASRSGFRTELRGIVPDTGEIKWVVVTGTVRCNDTGEPVRVDGITTDVTERREAEARLRESESRFRTIFENAGIGVALVSPDGFLLESNPALEQLLGYTTDELRTINFTELTHPDSVQRDVKLYRELMAGKRRRYEIEKRYIRKNGQLMWGRLVVSLIRDGAGNPQFGIGMVEDITQRKRAEEEILSLSDRLIYTQEQERSRIGRELHDGLGQQIAALSISVSGLKRVIPEQEIKTRERIEQLQQRISAIAEGVRRISHELHPAILELAGIVVALRSYCAQFSVDNKVAVSLEASENFEGISADAALCLYRVTQEALQNVAKHSGAKEARVQLERLDGQVRLTVTDPGRGFDPEAPAERTGLGLVSMKERVRLLNGTIEISSSIGEGTTLRVSIPLAAGAAA